MQPLSRAGLLLRILLPALIAPLMAISPIPYVTGQSLSDARQSLAYGNSATAAAHLARVAQRQPWRIDLWQRAGELALQGDQAQAAAGYLEEAARLGHLNLHGRLLLGDAYQQTGEMQAAIIQWETAIMLGTPGTEPHERLAAAYQASGMWDKTLEHLQKASALNPGRADLHFWLGRLLAARQPQDALPYLTLAGELDASLAPAAGELGRAIRLAAVEQDETYTLLEAGRALAGMGDWQYAMLAFRQAAELRPDYAPAWAWLAEARQQLQLQHASQLALANLQTALRLEPSSFSTHLFLALYWRRQGDDQQAISHLEAARQIEPGTPAVHIELADTLAQMGKLQDALRAYQRAASLQPQNALYQRLLASFCVRYQYQIVETGLPAARQAVLLNQHDAASLDVMAQVMMLLQDFSSAQRFLTRSLNSDPGYDPAQVNLGLLHALQGDLQEARRRWQSVIERSPDSHSAQQARRYMQTYFP